jgi:TPR repeat protein
MAVAVSLFAQQAVDPSTLSLAALQQHAIAGEVAAQFELGKRYDDGAGVPADKVQAAVWYRKAAEQGDPSAQSYLAYDYQAGEGVPKDLAQAAFWYRKAAEQDDAGSQNNLGSMYTNGIGVQQDFAQAVFWYRKAADQGDAAGEANLAACYENGHGVPVDPERARAWFGKAARQGDGFAKAELAKLDAQYQAAHPASVAQNNPSSYRQATTQEEYQSELRDHDQKVADLRQRADEAESEAEQSEALAQQAKNTGDEAASGNGGIAGIIAVLSSGATQTAAEIDAQKKRQIADDLRQQLREMGEEVIQPPPLQNSIADDAGRNYIGEARDRGLNNINAAADHDAELRAQQPVRQAQRATAAPTVSSHSNPSSGSVNVSSAPAPAKPKPAKGQGCVEITHLVTMDSKWDDGLGHCDKGVVGWLQNPTSGYANCAWRFNRPGGYGDGGEGTLKPGERTGGEMGGIWSCGALAPDIKYACFAAPADGSDPVDDNGNRCLSTVKWE